jgi:hypothetical protein
MLFEPRLERDSQSIPRTAAGMMESDLAQQLEAPLALLKSISERTFGSGQFPTPSQLQLQLSHLQSAVGDLLDIAASAMADLLEQVEDELALPEEALQIAREELRAVTEELEDQLGSLSDALMGARSFEELGAAREEVEGVELAMQATLVRLEVLLDSLVDGQLLEPLAEDSKSEEAAAVLELLAVALESVDAHLLDGQIDHLRQALSQVESAAEILRQVMAQAEER